MFEPIITTVVNIRHAPFDVYIGRAGHGYDGYFGNPIQIGARCPVCGGTHDRGGTIACFEVYARNRIAHDPEYRRRVRGLHGKTLGCFCAPDPCHGDVYARLAAELATAEIAADVDENDLYWISQMEGRPVSREEALRHLDNLRLTDNADEPPF